MKSYSIKFACFIFIIIGLLFAFCSCSNDNSANENTNNDFRQSDNEKQSKTNALATQEQLNIHIKNSKGEIDINDSMLANELIKALDDPDKVVEGGTGCPFGNKVTISKKQEILKEFFIAEDSCNTIKKTDRKIIEIERTTYQKVEDILNNSNNSLNRKPGIRR